MWFTQVASTLGLATWDIELYRDMGSSFVSNFISGNLTAYPIVGNPPLGLAFIGALLPLTERLVTPPIDVLLIPILFSALTCWIIYLVGSRYSWKVGLIAWGLVSFDPYSIQFSATFLDPIMNFFISIAIYLTVNDYLRSFRGVILLSFVLSLAVITKLTAAILVLLFSVLYAITFREFKKGLLILVVTGALAFGLTVQNWTLEGLREFFVGTGKMVGPGTPTFNTLRLPVIFGPFDIGMLIAYPWYLLTYLGIGYIHRSVLPYVSHMLLLVLVLVLSLVYRGVKSDRTLTLWMSASILSITFLPRNYWTANWAEGFVVGIIAKQFYPYYFLVTLPALSLFLAHLIVGRRQTEGADVSSWSKLLWVPILSFAALAPIPFVMLSMRMPYWDFIFTLIYNYWKDSSFIVGYYAFLLTVVILIYLVAFVVMMMRRIFRSQEHLDQTALT
ncbi:MAG: hypothetical protein NZ920_06225 [Aigarchaeota archaeon]|nr:hypothetical protein [Aigarchaeota archaeon]